MRTWTRRVLAVAGLALAFVAVSTVALGVREGSWAPVASVGWLPAVIVVAWPGARTRCLPRRRGRAS
jgi:hypothetical protein